MKHDYEKLGFKCGIEIHQQLDTAKLYCDCPSLVRDPNNEVKTLTRRLRPVIGESGNVDAAVAFESLKSKLFIYEFRDTSSCLVELDEEPPHQINQDALSIALQVANLVNARVVDEIQVMRKIVVDGSNVSGFQRTALVATDGYIETSKGRVAIPLVCIEEESSQKLEATDEYVRYRLDRLGVPLIEISTDASIKDPAHAQECAKKLGMILRSTGKVKRGIGSIRQDVNVSIRGGTRVEIKGFQDLKSIPKVVDKEVERQLSLIKKKKPVLAEVRKAEPDMSSTFIRPMPGAARMYPETDVLPIKINDEMLSSLGDVELLDDIVKVMISKHKIPSEIAMTLAKQGKAKFYSSMCDKFTNLKPSFIADLLLGAAKQVKKEFEVDIIAVEVDYICLFEALDEEKIAKESVYDILSKKKPVSEIISSYYLIDDEELEKKLRKIILANKGAPYGALMGKAMATLKGKASGKKIAQLLRKLS